MARGSVVCELTEHGPEQHAGLIRPLVRPEGGAVWATWTTPDEVVCLALFDCGKHGKDRERPCSLFGAHPGPCSYDRDDALAEDLARVALIDAALAVLAEADQHDRLAVRSAAHDAALLTWDELRARQIWTRMPACDHAAMYRLLALANSLRATRASVANTASELARDVAQMTRLWEASSPPRLPHGECATALLDALDRLPPEWRTLVLGGQREDRHEARMPLDEAVNWAARHSSEGLAPPPAEDDWKSEWDRKEDERRGATTSERLAKLPNAWQADAVRRIALGEDALGTVATAALSINVICGYGVDRASSGTGPTDLHLAAVRADPQKARGGGQHG
ncbi:hypothetical protein [Streptomyces sp. SAI-090]|jgi:hypothetical protein|uniref:hypothetical protein n=1 Tax=Streptomyces sp. SAI-090 TaxID=2940545 RepID=UPI0024745664|nr:hypothetical protein [Streptomyces sp. SAI-090]MDH6522349.1 hypothetical protein [Streptomyces sp. SAI-090]